MKSFRRFCIEQVEKINNKKSVAHGAEVDTSPSEDKAKSGTYKKFHTTIDGWNIAIENPLGSTREGTDPDGKKWKTTFKADYGYLKGTIGYDKDHIDVFIKPGYKGGNENVHVINQFNSDGTFDEHKVVFGATDEKEAMTIYNSNYEKGWNLGKSIKTTDRGFFRKWATSKEPKKGEWK